MAEFLYNKAAASRRLAGLEARSCGLAAERYFPIPSGVKKALGARGVAEVAHTAQLVTRDLQRWADAVFPMTRGHRDALWDAFPEFRDKTRLFLEAAGESDGDVDDPIGQPDAVYERCCALIEKGVEGILRRHADTTARPRP